MPSDLTVFPPVEVLVEGMSLAAMDKEESVYTTT